ncbi:MAG: family 20 glycosylhydrolase [Deltaproteobacteria bacterium]
MSEPASVPALEWLFPRPRRMQAPGSSWQLPAQLGWAAASEVPAPAIDWVELALKARGHALERRAAGGPVELELRVEPSSPLPSLGTAAQAYVLRIRAGTILLSAPAPVGLQYGLATLAQLIAQSPGARGQLALPELEITDAPDFAERAVLLDVSRDKVPTLATLRALIARLARWKVNQLQLYFEHTFAYAGHQRVWQHASPYTPEDMRELDAYCAARFIQLVPNQNSFGHMHRWLVHDHYRPLAECPGGFEHPWNWSSEPYGLCATDPGSLALLEELYDQLLPNFQSRMFNVGLDETFDLGQGRSKAACEERGTERVYLEFLQQVHARVQRRGHRMQFWGDIIVKRPELIRELPADAIALEWGYEADHPFAEHLTLFQRAGLDFYVCPGTSSWNSIAGRTENAILNLASAARQGKAAGAAGLLTTDWGDNGHLQPLSVSYLGLLLGAGFSWNVASAERPLELDVAQLLDRHVFQDAGSVLGGVARDLGNAYREVGSLRPNASALFWVLIKPERLFSPPGVTRESLEHTLAYVERVSAPLAAARPACEDGVQVVKELGWVRDVLRFACRLGIARSGLEDRDVVSALPARERLALRTELHALIERHRSLWLARNCLGGLADSAGRLERLLATLS